MEIHYSLEKHMLVFTEDNKKVRVFPVLVESCMNPGQYRLYPITLSVDEQNHLVSICSLQGNWMIDYKINPIEVLPFTPKQPQKRGCDGDCERCRKCC